MSESVDLIKAIRMESPSVIPTSVSILPKVLPTDCKNR